MTNKINTQPYKGTRDFYPEDFKVRAYVFNIWRKVCERYGFEEFDGPFLESFELYAAKSGEELVNEQLYSFEDRGGRKVAIRPEMTPTLARMVAARYKSLNFPVRWFTIPNMYRYEKPQRGRQREFFQLNVDILGVDGIEADFEILSTAIDIMREAGATSEMFELRVNNRKLMSDLYEMIGLTPDQQVDVAKTIDKKLKVSPQDFTKLLEGNGLKADQIMALNGMLEAPDLLLEKLTEKGSEGAKEVKQLMSLVKSAGYDEYVKFDPIIVRGLAYYTSTVFEQFDLNPENNRSMFGGGRYDDLVNVFIDQQIKATGYGMGDVTFINFLENWNLLPESLKESNTEYLVTVWPSESEDFFSASAEVAKNLRESGKNVELWLEKDTKLDKQLKYANKKGIKKVVILGEEELKKEEATLKDMTTGEQETFPLKEINPTKS